MHVAAVPKNNTRECPSPYTDIQTRQTRLCNLTFLWQIKVCILKCADDDMLISEEAGRPCQQKIELHVWWKCLIR